MYKPITSRGITRACQLMHNEAIYPRLQINFGDSALFFNPLPPRQTLTHALSLFVAGILEVVRGPRAPTLF